MSPMLDLQAQMLGRQIGRIRIGTQVTTADGKLRPSKLETFRLTTHSRLVADRAADLYGGDVRPWHPDGRSAQWEVVTAVAELAVMVPPGEVVSAWWEMWSGGGCVRRCDGYTETLTQTPCKCPPAGPDRAALAAQGKACKATTRLSVMLPDLPDVGVWRIDSHGYYSALGIGGTAALLQKARDAGVTLPATLRLRQEEVKRGGKTKRFPVIDLEIGASLREMTELGAGSMAAALPPAPARALGAAPAPQVTAGPLGRTADELLEAAADAGAREDVLVLWEEARRGGVLDDMVTCDDALESLRSVLTARGEALPRERVPS